MPNGDQPLAPNLDVSEERPEDGTRVVALRGELDVATVGRLRAALSPIIDDTSAKLVVVDLVEVTFIDSTGLMTLLNALRRLVRRDARLVLACSNPTVLRLFEATRTDATFDIAPTREQALSGS
ncbi:MAG: anti-sigma factor antagonist [Solirubrobacteraceae bacterium]|nr:anti-sigma factor antagonist [Solirubrobacteraceae bacterium]